MSARLREKTSPSCSVSSQLRRPRATPPSRSPRNVRSIAWVPRIQLADSGSCVARRGASPPPAGARPPRIRRAPCARSPCPCAPRRAGCRSRSRRRPSGSPPVSSITSSSQRSKASKSPRVQARVGGRGADRHRRWQVAGFVGEPRRLVGGGDPVSRTPAPGPAGRRSPSAAAPASAGRRSARRSPSPRRPASLPPRGPCPAARRSRAAGGAR